jgi:hypothetical protein
MVPENPLPDAMEELELDRAMGKLTDADYDALRASVTKGKPITASAMDNVSAQVGSVGSESSEAPSVIIHATSESELDARAEALIHAARSRVVTCSACGERPEPSAAFCSHCGRVIGGCPVCGATQTGPKGPFCTECGAALRA